MTEISNKLRDTKKPCLLLLLKSVCVDTLPIAYHDWCLKRKMGKGARILYLALLIAVFWRKASS